MRIKSFAIMFLCVLSLCSGLMLAGCGDKYSSLAIEVDKTEISLKIGADTDEEGLTSTALLNATLKGASAEMTRGMSFRFEDSSIVTSSVINNTGDTNTIQLTASTAGTTKMYIVSNEIGRVVSEPISVTVYRDAETMTFDSSKKPRVKLGDSLTLVSNDLIRFAVNNEAVKIYPNEATFSLMTPEDSRWNNAYGTTVPEGVTVADNVLNVSEDARCGVVQLVATMGELNTAVYVMVYKEIDPNAVISLYQNETEVKDTIKSIINPMDKNGNRMSLLPQISDSSQKYQLSIKSYDNDILQIGSPNASNEINANVLNSGFTKVDVTASVIDTVTNTVYITFTKTYDVEISRIVNYISVSSDDFDYTNENAQTTVQDWYVDGVYGKRIHFKAEPNNDENSGPAINTDVVLSVTQIDGEDYTQTENFSDVVIYVNDRKYVWGETISNDSDIYVRLGDSTAVKKSFRLTLLANTFDEDLPVASNYVDFNVEVGVSKIETDVDSVVLAVGMEKMFSLKYYDRNNIEGTGTPKFTFNTSEYFEITDNGDYSYTIKSLKEGDAIVNISAESGAMAEFELNSRIVLKEIGITLSNTKNVVNTTDVVDDGKQKVVNTGISEFLIAKGGSVDLTYSLNPANIGRSSFSITSVTTNDPQGQYVSVDKNFNNGKLRLNALNVTANNSYVVLTIKYSHYVENSTGDGIELQESTRNIRVGVYQTIRYIYWEGTNSSQKATQYILNENNLNYLDKSKGTVTLNVKYDESASYFINGKTIDWSTNDKRLVINTKNVGLGSVEVTARLNSEDKNQYYFAEVYAKVQDYAMTYVLTCNFVIENPAKVSNITIANSYDETFGIRLNDVGAKTRTQIELVPRVEPSNAYNSQVDYVILNESRTAVVTEDEAIIQFVSQNKNIIGAISGKSGVCWVRIYPQDALTSKGVYSQNAPYKDIKVVVEDGTEDRPYSIYDSVEFLAIGENEKAMQSHYLLMNSIDLSGYSANCFPLGRNLAFTGTIQASSTDTKFTISGLPVAENLAVNDKSAYLGVFSQIINNSEKPAIQNINFYFSRGSADLRDLDSTVSTVYTGLLAGRIKASLSGVFVGYTGYRSNYINIMNIPATVTNFYFGALAGELMGGSVSDSYTNVSIKLTNVSNDSDSAKTLFAVGGAFGRFSGTSFGQETSLVSNVKIIVEDKNDTSTKLESINKKEVVQEGIGGLIGIADKYLNANKEAQSGVVYSMQVSGSVTATNSVNVGGLVGLNNITLGKDSGNTLYKNLASVRVNGLANVGGFVGTNLGTVNYGIAENYDTVAKVSASDLIWVQGLQNVGGFAGYSGESALITYSYAMSYVNRVMIANGTSPSENYFYGDILGVANTGGFVGFNTSKILNSFAYAKIQQIETNNSQIKDLEKFTGGFAGAIEFTTEQSYIYYSFAIGEILTNSISAGNVYGEYVGKYSAASDNLITQSYANVDINANSEKTYNFIAQNLKNTLVSACFYMVADNNSSEETNGGYELSRMQLSKNTSIYTTAGWGFDALGTTGEKKNPWISWESTLSGINKDLPILYDANRKMLYSQIITDIKANPRIYKSAGANLPTYFGYSADGNVLGSVVLLDNIPLKDNERSILLKDFLDISITPNDPQEWKISIESSDYSIMEVVQPKQNLDGATLVFKSCGVVTLTLRSLLNIDKYCTVEINVVDGFKTFTLEDSKGKDITKDEYKMYIKVGTQQGYSIHTQYTQTQSGEYVTKKGLVYSTADPTDADCVSFSKYNFVNGEVYIADDIAIISGLKANEDDINFIVRPYIELQFNNNTYRYVFDNLQKSFKAKVYNGISAVEIITGIEANMPSGSDVYVSVNVITDNTDIVDIENFSLTKDGVTVGEIGRYAELISVSDDVKIATDNNFACYRDGKKIENKLTIAQIVQDLIDDNDIDAYIEIGGKQYKDSADISAMQEFLITSCKSYTYLLSLKGEDRVITQNVVFGLQYTVVDTACGDRWEKGDTITFIPASVKNLTVSHFTYGAESMTLGEAASTSISPGTKGILRIDVAPYYANFDYVGVYGNPIGNTSPLMMQQLLYVGGSYKSVTTNSEYDAYGSLILRKATGIDSNGNEYFDGRIFVSTLITAGTPEGSEYTLVTTCMKNGAPIFNPDEKKLVTTFAPYATLTLDSDYTNNIVARGTVANLRLKGTLLNSRLSLYTSYTGLGDSSQFARSSFGTLEKDTFTSGEREEVDMIIPFYVGLLARPDNAKIVIRVTIDSWTKLGGQLNPLIITCTLNIVDYIPRTVYTNGTQAGNLEISINTYSNLIANMSVDLPKISDFETFVGYEYGSDEDNAKAEFLKLRATLEESISAKTKYINALGNGQGGVWWFNDGSGYSQINIGRGYLDFLVIFDETTGFYMLRGSEVETNFPLRLSFEATYVFDATENCYRFVISTEDYDTSKLLDEYMRLLEQDFYADLTDQSDEDVPYSIDSANAFRNMVAGGNYMLLADIELDNWSPLDVEINSLDGNGHIIYLNSFAKATDSTSATYGLFSTLAKGTVVKNLIIDVSHNIFIDLQNVKTVKFGFIAGVNNGIIYNCDIVVTQGKTDWKKIYDNTAKIVSSNADLDFGKNIFDKIINEAEGYSGSDTYASTFVMTSKTVDSTNVTSLIGGLVGENSSTGSITNSRIGRIDTNTSLGTTTVMAQQGLNFFASGTVGGLVGENSGVISNSYFANGYIVNSLMDIYSSSNTNGARTGGLVAVQNSGGRIFGSYARGLLTPEMTRSTMGGVIAYGSVGGLVHSNSGVISNSYSNITLSSASGVGGFVYENLRGGRISNSYSLSQVKTQNLINGMFIGVDDKGILLDNANSVVENCFYLTDDEAIVDKAERALPLMLESWSDATGSSFEGFAISTEEDGENTWYIDSERSYLGPQLYLADQVFVSSRQNGGSENANYLRGTKINPLIITSLDSWNNRIFNYQSPTHKSSYLKVLDISTVTEPNFEYAEAYVMLLTDLDFENSISTVTSKMRFVGHFYGNGHIISGLNVTQAVTELTAPNSFGLFAEIQDSAVTNLSLILEEELTSLASHVGVLAGTIQNSVIEDITITSNSSKGKITGTNMVGALAGLVKGDSYVYNIQTNLSVTALNTELKTYTYYNSNNIYSANISYAGGIIGVLDLDKAKEDSNITNRVRNLTISRTIYTENTSHNSNIELSGGIVGGIIGLIGTNSEVYKAYFNVNADENSATIRGRNFTGGLVGENRGTLLNSRLSLPLADQIESDSGILATDNESKYVGYTGLFASQNESYAVGGLVGLNIGGTIKYSYNRIAVVNTKAVAVGGLIGLTINAPQSYDTLVSVDSVLGYLQNINKTNILAPVTNGISYEVSGDTLKSADGSKLKAGAILQEVYTTAFCNGGSVIGGLVGVQVNAPIYTSGTNASRVAGVNAYNTSDSEFMTRIADSNQIKYFGSATGYLGLNYKTTPADSNIVAYVRDLTDGVASQQLYVTTSVGSKSINPIGNAGSEALSKSVVATSFIKASTDSENKPFENFDSEVWNLDTYKLEYRFPYHKIGYDSPVKDIHNEQEFFEYLSNTRASSHYRIVSNLTITGEMWAKFYKNTDNYYSGEQRTSLGTESNTVRGKLEGAVSGIKDGKPVTTSATINFVNFNNEQMKVFHSLFGYTNNFKMSNLNFIFKFDYDVNLIASEMEDFGLLALTMTATTLNNINITLASTSDSGTVTKHELSYVNTDVAGKTHNIAIVTARSSGNNVFNNVTVDARIVATNVKLSSSVTSEFTMGALVGTAYGPITIIGSNLGQVVLKYEALDSYETHIGALVGESKGVVKLSGSESNTSITGIMDVTTSGAMPSYLGGVIGKTSRTDMLNLNSFSSDVDITLTRNNPTDSKDYVGGITSSVINANINKACTYGDISITGGNGDVYVGGLAGECINDHTFANAHSGYFTQNSSSYSNIKISGNAGSYSHIYVGGIFGSTTERITMKNGKDAPTSNEAIYVYSALYSATDININAQAGYIYAGGIIGLASQGIITDENEFKTFEKPNIVLRVGNSGFVGELIVHNELSGENSGANYVGGLIGESQLVVQDAYSNGALVLEATAQNPVYLGGIVGLADNHIYGAVSLSIINISREYNDKWENVTFVDPITTVAILDLTGKNKAMQINVVDAYCSPELNGIYGEYGTTYSAQEMYSASTCESIVGILKNWTYVEKSYNNEDTNTFALIVPKSLSEFVTNNKNGVELAPIVISDYSEMLDLMDDSTYKHKTVFLNSNIPVNSGQVLREITNIRKIVGNSYSFEIASLSESNLYGFNNIGLYQEIPNNVLISALGIKFGTISISTSASDLSIGALAGINYGTIFNVSIGALPSIDTSYMNSQTKTVADFSNNSSIRYQNSIINSQEIATILVDFASSSSNSFVGGMFGKNYGSITNSFVSVDLGVYGQGSDLSVGSVSGKSISAILDSIMTNGRINVSTKNTKVGGVIGSATNSVVKGVVENVNIGIFAEDASTQAGFAFGEFTGGAFKGVIVNTDISSTDFESNNLYSENGGFTTQQMSSNESLSFIAPQDKNGKDKTVDNGFRSELWTQSATNFYGYPLLNTITNVDWNTGSGSKNDPYQFAESSQLLSIANSTAETNFCLTRDMVISPQNYANVSKISLQSNLNGMGHTVVIYDLSYNREVEESGEESNEIWLGLFREIKEKVNVNNIGVAYVGDINIYEDATIYFGGLTVCNYGDVKNCYAMSYSIVSEQVVKHYECGTITFSKSQANSYIGGLVSQNYGTITSCWSDVNFVGKDGHFGGLIGLQGQYFELDEEENPILRQQGSVEKCFSSGSIYLNSTNTDGTETSAGGLVGKLTSSFHSKSGYVIKDCYVYGAKLGASTSNLNIGALIGYNVSKNANGQIVLNTNRTYAYVATDVTVQKISEGSTLKEVIKGNYVDLNFVGNKNEINNTDSSSSFVVAHYSLNSEIASEDFLYRQPQNLDSFDISSEKANLVKIGSANTDGLRSYGIGTSTIYSGWNYQTWARNGAGVGTNSTLYLKGVTPVDRQENPYNESSLTIKNVFRLNTIESVTE